MPRNLAGAIAPGLIFQALALTQVNNVVLVGRLEPPLALALSIWLLQARVNFWDLGAIVSFVGVILTISLQPTVANAISMGFLSVGTGDILAALAAVALAASTIIGKLKLFQVPLGIYTIFRTALGTVIFFFAALLLYGRHHFRIVVVGQSFSIAGLRAASISEASLAGSFTPAGIVAAYLILGEVPTLVQYIGGGVILIGIFISQIGIWRQKSINAASQVSSTQKLQEIESGMGFKGI